MQTDFSSLAEFVLHSSVLPKFLRASKKHRTSSLFESPRNIVLPLKYQRATSKNLKRHRAVTQFFHCYSSSQARNFIPQATSNIEWFAQSRPPQRALIAWRHCRWASGQRQHRPLNCGLSTLAPIRPPPTSRLPPAQPRVSKKHHTSSRSYCSWTACVCPFRGQKHSGATSARLAGRITNL